MFVLDDGIEAPLDGHYDMLATYWLMARERGDEHICREIDAEVRATYTPLGYQSFLTEIRERQAAGEGAAPAEDACASVSA
jgi:hypothetical protein